MEFSALERTVIEHILSQPIEDMDILRQQFAAASVVTRDYDRIGFYTTISVPRSLPPLPYGDYPNLGSRDGAMGVAKSAPRDVISFKLWVDGGYLACLEGETSGKHWPNERDIRLTEFIVVPAKKASKWKWPWSKGEQQKRPGLWL
jgi:hypothetical protein